MNEIALSCLEDTILQQSFQFDVWILQSLCSLFFNVPWAILKRGYDMDVSLRAAHSVAAHSLHCDKLLVLELKAVQYKKKPLQRDWRAALSDSFRDKYLICFLKATESKDNARVAFR